MNRESVSNLLMIEVCAIAEGYFFFHGQVAQQFAVQNLTLPPSMSVAKVTEYVYASIIGLNDHKIELKIPSLNPFFEPIDGVLLSTPFEYITLS